jgi:hypothetical protein
VLGVKESPDVRVSVEALEQEDAVELYHSTDAVLSPEYVTFAVSPVAVCPKP